MKAEFDQFMQFASAGISASSAEVYRSWFKTLTDFYPRKKLVDVDRDNIAEWVDHLKETQNGTSVQSHVRFVKRFFTWAVEEELIQSNPVILNRLALPPKATPDKMPFTYEEYQLVLKTARKPGVKPYWPHAIICGWHTGARLSDVARMMWDQVDFEKDIVTIFPKKMRRYGQRLDIPMEPEFREHLMSLPGERFGFLSPQLVGYYQAGVSLLSAQFRRICDAAGFPRHSFHSLRHGAVSRLLNAGVDGQIVGSITGLSQKQISTYSHISIDAKAAALEKSRAQ